MYYIQESISTIRLMNIYLSLSTSFSSTLLQFLPLLPLCLFPPCTHNHRLLSVTILLSRVLYKQNHTLCTPFSLNSFSQNSSLEIHQYILAVHSFLLPIICDCMDMSHSFIHVPTDGCLGCIQVFTITNKVAVNICVQTFIWVSILGKYLEVEQLEYLISICFLFKFLCQTSFQCSVAFYISTSKV